MKPVTLLLSVSLAFVVVVQAGFGAPLFNGREETRALEEHVLNKLEWRNIGPAIMGGRIDDFAVVESDPRIIYTATASGGLWKTTNNAVTWEPVFDDQSVSSIGDVSIAPSDPSVVWVGTGEVNNRQSSSWGNGVYKSNDGGRTWMHLGLEETHHISRIVIHPRNPSFVFVAALGRLWGPNRERGVYKSTDGGKTWTNTLFLNEDTGITDLAMDPMSPDTLYAAAYQRRRTAFGFNGAGSGSGLYKTIDGGETWNELTRDLPAGDTGRIGIGVYRKDPNIVYAVIENDQGGIFRSEDKGETWTRMSPTNPRPGYYSKIRIDPQNDQRIWLLGPSMYSSEDGGRSFRADLVHRIHGDFHAMWINPTNSDHLLVGSDGGVHLSYDRGRTWEFVNTMPLGQFYEISVDMEKPYNIYGGLQDNGIWRGPSRTLYQQGITNEDWFLLGGGDGTYVQVDPSDTQTVYFASQYGNLQRMNLRTFEVKVIQPKSKEGEEAYRFDWNSPLFVSPHDSQTIYYGGNRLFKSTDRGDTWTATRDLTTNPKRDSMPIMGVILDETALSVHDGTATYGELTTVTESSLHAGLLYVGTDDGNLQVTRDGGLTWTNVADKIPGLPKGTYVSRVVASRFEEGRVYATFDGHRSDDFSVYIYVSEDFGESWTSISANVQAGHTVSVIREHPLKENLLFVGTEFGAYVTFDRGRAWHRFSGSLPTVPVDDIAVHPRDNDLVLGTHGRSAYVLDDITPLVQMSESVLQSDLHLFEMRPATMYRLHRHRANTGHQTFIAPNPPYGALLQYYLKSEPEEVKITILDDKGNKIRELVGPKEIGLNRTNWDLRFPRPVTPPEKQAYFVAPPGWRPISFPAGPFVLPGVYTVEVAAGESQAVTNVVVEEDPRIEIPDADRESHLDAVLRVGEMMAACNQGDETVQKLKSQLHSLEGKPSLPEEVRSAIEPISDKLEELEMTLSRTGGLERRLGATGPPPQGRPVPLYPRLTGLYVSLNRYTKPPNQNEQERIDALSFELDSLLRDLHKIVEEDVPALNQLIHQNKVPLIGPG